MPLAVMTYYNLVFRAGHRRMARVAGGGRGGRGDRARPLARGARAVGRGGRRRRGRDRAAGGPVHARRSGWPRICGRSRGFVYAVARMGVTGERAALGRRGRRRWSAGSGPSPTCRCASASGSRRPPRRSRRAGWPTGWWSARRWSAGCSTAAGPRARPASWASCAGALDRLTAGISRPGTRTRQPLWPPKPKELESTGPGCQRPGLARHHVEVDLGVELLQAGGRRDEAVVDAQHRGHRLDGARPRPGRGRSRPWWRSPAGPGSPNTLLMARASARSLSGVEVPCALMWRDVGRRQPGVLQRQLHAGDRARRRPGPGR